MCTTSYNTHWILYVLLFFHFCLVWKRISNIKLQVFLDDFRRNKNYFEKFRHWKIFMVLLLSTSHKQQQNSPHHQINKCCFPCSLDEYNLPFNTNFYFSHIFIFIAWFTNLNIEKKIIVEFPEKLYLKLSSP